MKLASATINDVQHEWQKVFAAELEKRAPGKVKTEIYPASQLGAIPRMVEGVLLGTIESFVTPTSFMVPTDPRFTIYDVPGLFVSPEHVVKVMHDPAYRDHFETMFLDRGIRIIGAIYNSPTLVLTKKPAPKLEDLKGMKIRTFASPLQMEPMKSVGAIPVPLALTEVIPQLQSGGLDGMLAGMPILTAFKYYDVARYVTDLNFAQIISINVVNESWFKAQPKDVQDAIRAAGREAETAGIRLGCREPEEVERRLGRQQGRDPQARAGRAGRHDGLVPGDRRQDRRGEPVREGGIRTAEEAGRREEVVLLPLSRESMSREGGHPVPCKNRSPRSAFAEASADQRQTRRSLGEDGSRGRAAKVSNPRNKHFSEFRDSREAIGDSSVALIRTVLSSRLPNGNSPEPRRSFAGVFFCRPHAPR